MQITLKAAFLLLAVLASGGVLAVQATECLKPILPGEALDLSNQAVEDAGFDLADLDVVVTKDIQRWKDQVQMSIRGNAGEKAKEEAEQMHSMLQSHTNFFSISYQPKKHPDGHTRLGGVSVLLDADAGAVLIIQPAHRKAIYPIQGSGAKEKQVKPCPSPEPMSHPPVQ